jgi:hypothetical protein
MNDDERRRVISVDLPWACFGLIVECGRVVEAAPIYGWMTGKDERYAVDYFKRRGAHVVYCSSTPK